MEIALHDVPMCIQTAAKHKEMAAGAFLNIVRRVTVQLQLQLKHFMKPHDYLDAPLDRVQHFILSIG
jgi:hypothetical protein